MKLAPGKGILFSKNGHLKVLAYTDANWAWSIDDSFNIRLLYVFKGNLGTWRSKKLHVVARTIAKAKYRGVALGTTKMLWLRNILRDLGYGMKEAMKLYCDTKAACETSLSDLEMVKLEGFRLIESVKLETWSFDLPSICQMTNYFIVRIHHTA